MDKLSGSGIFPDSDLDPGDPKRPDPDPQHCFQLLNSKTYNSAKKVENKTMMICITFF